MELLTPGAGLIAWQIFILVNTILIVICWIIILTSKKFDSRMTLAWMICTLLLPVIGPVLFFVVYRKLKRAALPGKSI